MEPYVYNDPSGYFWHSLSPDPFNALPQTIVCNGISFKRKSEFHVTVINGRGVAKQLAGGDTERAVEIEATLKTLMHEYVQANPITFIRFEDDIRLASETGRTSIAARCEVTNIEGFFKRVNEHFSSEIPTQPPHVSLYTDSDRGVGIDSVAEMEAYPKVDLPEIQHVLNHIARE